MSGYEASYAGPDGSTVAIAQGVTEQAAVKAVNEVMKLRLSQRRSCGGPYKLTTRRLGT